MFKKSRRVNDCCLNSVEIKTNLSTITDTTQTIILSTLFGDLDYFMDGLSNHNSISQQVFTTTPLVLCK